ncbi:MULTISPECIES: ribosomal protein S18-alanine N-acetyltransferase [Nitrincola]|uniref:[Ribosomal protein bS18]-alanine N-acetyltransferase n=1 Tax=Nitrincola nitratireducens TaxID=1229521 RepID=W9UY33_9GAMM|nr:MULTISPECIES: ribosomal protein S18-alanine N-acetyltransferase [Nitrincola]EXJ11979.1 ribosomal-protein-alanine N-acetyltransferase [Nitrincola nitratireducens]
MIDRLLPNQLPAVRALEAQCFDDPWSENLWLRILKSGAAWQWHHQGQIQAFMLCSCVLDEAELLRIGTLPSARQQGLALQLLERGIEDLATLGIIQLHLEVRRSNTAAIRLYERAGFAMNGVRNGYYPAEGSYPKEDALLFKRTW